MFELRNDSLKDLISDQVIEIKNLPNLLSNVTNISLEDTKEAFEIIENSLNNKEKVRKSLEIEWEESILPHNSYNNCVNVW